MKSVEIEKADGTREAFRPEKLLQSLARAGASDSDAKAVLDHIEEELHPGMKTSSIYRHAFHYLKSLGSAAAAKYSLRQSLAELGPSGFPFEYFVGELMKSQGFNAEIGFFMEGGCAKHEVDVVADSKDRLIIAEVKFHNQYRLKSDLQVALYVKARFDDLAKTQFGRKQTEGQKAECWLITNTKFTSHAIHYSECNDIHLLGWSYPKKGNLQELIEAANFEPLTTLTTLTSHEKNELLGKGVVLCKALRDNDSLLSEIGVTGEKAQSVMSEVDNVCHL